MIVLLVNKHPIAGWLGLLSLKSLTLQDILILRELKGVGLDANEWKDKYCLVSRGRAPSIDKGGSV